jgi:YbgC/YbaW family acyl-CoA thioester hydrolase
MNEFSTKIQILESHLDTFGHVNNATYLSLYEQARWQFITERGFGLKEIQKRAVGPVILELNLKFKKEITNREVIEIKSFPEEPKRELIMQMKQNMLKEDGSIASTLELTVGLMDLKARKLIAPTPEWLHAIGLA